MAGNKLPRCSAPMSDQCMTAAWPAPAAAPARSLYTLRVELYSQAEDKARLVAEALLTAAVFVQLLLQLWQIAAAR
jgi:hypothetical protein